MPEQVEFDYRKEEDTPGEITYRPIAKVYLMGDGGNWVPEYFYVDSGADISLIPIKIGAFLGLDKVAGKVKNMGGVGGNIPIRLVTVPMKIGKHRFDCKIAWAQIERVPFLLGRESVFEYFDITFRQQSKKVIFILSSG